MTMPVPEAAAWRDELRLVGQYTFELPRTARAGMRVPARVYADETLLATILEGEAMVQLTNVAMLPGVVRHARHARRLRVSGWWRGRDAAAGRRRVPGGVGFDINCDVRMLSLPLTHADLGDRLELFVTSCRDRSHPALVVAANCA